MLDCYDESELLDLIEGDLDPKALAALQQRLAKDADARSIVADLARDRASLRALGEPVLPMDFMAQIEPMLTRPMLIETVADAVPLKPGEFRRRHRRANRRWRVGRIAVAAALMLAALGGAWVMIDGFVLNRAGGDDDAGRFARGSNAPHSPTLPGGPSRDRTLAGETTTDQLGPGVVHHDRPQLDMARLATAQPPVADKPPGSSHQPDVNPVIPVDFAIVLDAKQVVAGEAAMSRVVLDLGERGALVKNFSFAEAQRLAEQYRLAHGEAAANQPMTASIAPSGAGEMISKSDLYQLAQRVRDQLRANATRGDAAVGDAFSANANLTGDAGGRPNRAGSVGDGSGSAAGGDATSMSVTLAGPAALGPTLEQQLEFSSRGAVYTIAVPASEVVNLLERLSLSEGQSMMLQMLPPPPAFEDMLMSDRTPKSRDAASRPAGDQPPPAPPTLVWLTEGPRVRAAMSRLTQARDGAVVLVPVIIK